MGQFELYQCDDKSVPLAQDKKTKSFPLVNQRLILDSVTLANLEIIENSKGLKYEKLVTIDFIKIYDYLFLLKINSILKINLKFKGSFPLRAFAGVFFVLLILFIFAQKRLEK